MKVIRPRLSSAWAIVFTLLATLSCTLPSYELTPYFKAALLAFSLTIIHISKCLISLKKNKLVFAYCVYCTYLALNIKILDHFSLRLMFNSATIITAAYAATFLTITKRHLILTLPVVIASGIYAYIFNINPTDGKPQVHAQIFSFIYISTIIFYRNPKTLLLTNVTAILLSRVRSALFGYTPVIFFISTYKLFTSKKTLLVVCALFISITFYLTISNINHLHEHLGSFTGSLRWRILHWGYIFSGYEKYDWIFGKGLGHSWRSSSEIEAFYTEGKKFVATHSNYVKIISETGLLGLAAFSWLILYVYKNSPPPIQALVVFYIGYGFFDEGVWHFDWF